jgi:hypothetical protein
MTEISARDGWVNFIFFQIFSAHGYWVQLPMCKKSTNHCTLLFAEFSDSLNFKQLEIAYKSWFLKFLHPQKLVPELDHTQADRIIHVRGSQESRRRIPPAIPRILNWKSHKISCTLITFALHMWCYSYSKSKMLGIKWKVAWDILDLVSDFLWNNSTWSWIKDDKLFSL